jgi:DNA-directed RNA polymerase specialized sigma24 family protein
MQAWAVSDGGTARQEDRDRRAAERLTALYEAYAADAFRYALHLTGRREDAEDVVQQVFLQAYAMLEAGHGLASPRAWLMKATKHRSLNLVRDRHDAPVATASRVRAAALERALAGRDRRRPRDDAARGGVAARAGAGSARRRA